MAGAATGLRTSVGAPQSPAEREQLERWLQPAQLALSEEASAAAWAGQAIPIEKAFVYALADVDEIAESA